MAGQLQLRKQIGREMLIGLIAMVKPFRLKGLIGRVTLHTKILMVILVPRSAIGRVIQPFQMEEGKQNIPTKKIGKVTPLFMMLMVGKLEFIRPIGRVILIFKEYLKLTR